MPNAARDGDDDDDADDVVERLAAGAEPGRMTQGMMAGLGQREL